LMSTGLRARPWPLPTEDNSSPGRTTLFAELWLVKGQNTPFDQPFVADMGVTTPGTTPRRRRGQPAVRLPASCHPHTPLEPLNSSGWRPRPSRPDQGRLKHAVEKGQGRPPPLPLTPTCRPDKFRRTLCVVLRFPCSAQRSIECRQLLPRPGGDQRQAARGPVEQRGRFCGGSERLKRSAPALQPDRGRGSPGRAALVRPRRTRPR
jgi:hypothetical protein